MKLIRWLGVRLENKGEVSEMVYARYSRNDGHVGP